MSEKIIMVNPAGGSSTQTLLIGGLLLGGIVLVLVMISGWNPLNMFKDLLNTGVNTVKGLTYSTYDSRKGKCGSKAVGGVRAKKACLQTQINYCSKGGVFNNGGGQNVKCFTDRAVPMCDNNEWCVDENGKKVPCPCYPDDVSCAIFKNPNNYNVNKDGNANQKCQGDLQGGPKCLADCCAAQKKYCDANTAGDLLGSYATCMSQRGCA